MAQTLYRVGTETKVLHGGTGSLTTLPDGGWVVAWSSNTAVFQQRYDKGGNALWGTEGRRVNITTDDNPSQPQILALAGGGWVVTWTSDNQDGSGKGVYQQAFDKDGNALFSSDRRVHVTTESHQTVPALTALADGGWVVTWQSDEQDGSGFGVYQQRFDKHGNAAWAEDRLVNSTTENAQGSPQVAALADGGWIVTWHANQESGFDGYGIYQQRFDKDGNALWTEDRHVNVWTKSHQKFPVVAGLADGGWVVVWQSDLQENPSSTWAGGTGIYMERFDKDGRPASETDLLVNVSSKDLETRPQVTALANGGWVVTWDKTTFAGSDSEVYQQVFDESGQALSAADILVNSTTDGYQLSPHVTALPDGSWVVTWWSSSMLGSSPDTYQQRFMLNQAPSDIQLTGGEVREAAATGRIVGSVAGADVNVASGDKLSYQLLDDAGGRFVLDGTTLKVAKGTKIDFEQAKTHTVKIRVTDNDGMVLDKVIEIRVADVARENVRGTSKGDKLTGGRNGDIFRGMNGNDTIDGGYGNDKLYGGKGKDIFVFKNPLSSKSNRDIIDDYKPSDDAIWLDNAIFKKLGKKGSEAKPQKLKKAFFIVGSEAQDRNDYLIYNDQTGILSYDKDGSGKAKAVAIAVLPKHLMMKHDEFFII